MESSLGQDSGIETSMEASFRVQRRLFESTPKIVTQSTPSNNSKKRKRWNNLAESCPSSPQFSSTLNESGFTKKFEEIQLQDYYFHTDTDEHKSKHFKEDKYTVPLTPEPQISNIDSTPKKPHTFPKKLALVADSPLKQAQGLLYPNIASKTPIKKPRERFGKITEEKAVKEENPKSKSRLGVEKKSLTPFELCVSNPTIMNIAFPHMSDGDIYRLSEVNQMCRNAVLDNKKAEQRLHEFSTRFEINKENYTITPPSSPEQSSWEPSSPNSRSFKELMKLKSQLHHNETLIKCPSCCDPSVVQNDIAQCQKISCGYIFCTKCGSFAYNYKEFIDKCENVKILDSPKSNKKSMMGLLDKTNNSFHDSLTLSPIKMHSTIVYSSGYESIDVTQSPIIGVKRNLSKTFASNEGNKKTPLFEKNRSLLTSNQPKTKEAKLRTSLAPVIKTNVKKVVQVPEPSSPPRVKQHAACSKQSKRNLKRLTR